MVKTVLHDRLVVCQCGVCCGTALIEQEDSLGGRQWGCWLGLWAMLMCLMSPRICNNVAVGWKGEKIIALGEVVQMVLHMDHFDIGREQETDFVCFVHHVPIWLKMCLDG